MVKPPSSVFVIVSRAHSLNIFSSETIQIHMAPLWDRGLKVCSNGPGHMTKMAAMAIYGKNLLKSSSVELTDQYC